MACRCGATVTVPAPARPMAKPLTAPAPAPPPVMARPELWAQLRSAAVSRAPASIEPVVVQGHQRGVVTAVWETPAHR